MSEGRTSDAPAAARALAAGEEAFGAGWQPSYRATAPGRIELLGNHLDYNGGPVLAAAIDRFMVVYAAETTGPDQTVAVIAADIDEENLATFRAADLAGWRNPTPPPRSLDYVRGVIAGVLDRPAVALRAPVQLSFAGDVPIGFGVSSSAALCVGLSLALTRQTPPQKELVLLAQEAEHRAGTPCGTMDQSTSIAGGTIRFDAATLECEQLSPDLGDLVFAVADSGIKRSLGASSYPKRVQESAEALAIANAVLGRDLPHLAALTPVDLDLLEARYADRFPEPLLARARHVVTETERVEQGARALRAGDWATFGALMTASGRSSATDYAISHPRVEELVAEALTVPGVLGARMMGGGEGGTALLLLPRDRVAALEQTLCASYYARYRMAERDDLIHVCAYADGAHGEELAP